MSQSNFITNSCYTDPSHLIGAVELKGKTNHLEYHIIGLKDAYVREVPIYIQVE